MDTVTYREIDGHELAMDLFPPTAPASGGALLLFHGGGWNRGSRDSFHPFCEQLAARGLFCATASYRLYPEVGEDVREIIADARAAVTWLRERAAGFGFDPQRLAAGGGSAGGHLAACCGIIPDASWPASKPDALVLYNPVVDQGPGGFGFKRVGDYNHEVSPLHRINRGCPPSCFLLGTEDDGIPVETGLAFQRRVQAAGGRCDLHLFGGMSHGFYQPSRERYHECMAIVDAFLTGLGFL